MLAPSQTVMGDYCTYALEEYYYDKSKIRWGKVVDRRITDPNAQLAGSGLDRSKPSSGAIRTPLPLLVQQGFRVFMNTDGAYGRWFFDHGGKLAPAIGDVRVRRALNYANRSQEAGGCALREGSVPTSLPNYGGEGEGRKVPD